MPHFSKVARHFVGERPRQGFVRGHVHQELRFAAHKTGAQIRTAGFAEDAMPLFIAFQPAGGAFQGCLSLEVAHVEFGRVKFNRINIDALFQRHFENFRKIGAGLCADSPAPLVNAEFAAPFVTEMFSPCDESALARNPDGDIGQ